MSDEDPRTDDTLNGTILCLYCTKPLNTTADGVFTTDDGSWCDDDCHQLWMDL